MDDLTLARARRGEEAACRALVVLYQRRITTDGHAFATDTPWMRELADSFPFQETPDQLTAIDDVLGDMASSHPMDRNPSICGDTVKSIGPESGSTSETRIR